MQISEIMHQGIISVNINDTVKNVAAVMKAEDIGAVPVMEEGKPVGFVTDRDIVISCVAEGHSLDEPISHAMTDDLITIDCESEVHEASRMMRENKVSRLLVMEDEKPIGMVSLQDLSSIDDEDLSGKTLNSIKRN
ncbi:MAG: CBS domain-containing protein [Bdellovibrionales bacterium]|nr:CBS domain-containing protein [Bdellovibrionales bacterium]